jgi:hypothetical protein
MGKPHATLPDGPSEHGRVVGPGETDVLYSIEVAAICQFGEI